MKAALQNRLSRVTELLEKLDSIVEAGNYRGRGEALAAIIDDDVHVNSTPKAK